MVKTTVGFSLSAYLREISYHVTLPSGSKVNFDEVSFSSNTLDYDLDTIVHSFSAGAVADTHVMKDTVGLFRME
jgi:hypothetical protein